MRPTVGRSGDLQYVFSTTYRRSFLPPSRDRSTSGLAKGVGRPRFRPSDLGVKMVASEGREEPPLTEGHLGGASYLIIYPSGGCLGFLPVTPPLFVSLWLIV
ncbi:hypothetical protein HMPREF1556_00193 [Porphyromonas sp. oral taxon 278 str. W7784]|nr:hypothetical protein HMPREF1556_00193 [Porphyromonas sp. oral taxon 278 str. W7784]